MANVRDTQSIFSALMESHAAKRAKVNKILESKKTVKESADMCGFTGRLLKESVADDIIDNITVVTDPDKTVEELEERADDIQDAIDATPEGEAAFSDEYVGDRVYACPVCGESFFADEEYKEGDICPICKAEPQDGFLMQGVVAPTVPEADKAEDEVIADDTAIEDTEADSVVGTEVEDAADDDVAEECVKPSIKTECEEPTIEIEVDLSDNVVDIKAPKETGAEIDEASFEDNLNQFVEENYKNVIEGINVDKCEYDKDEDALYLECTARCKNGSKAPLEFQLKESRHSRNRSILVGKELKNAFKIESNKPAFIFRVANNNGKVVCEGLKYRYTTTHSKAGKVKVEGVCRRRK